MNSASSFRLITIIPEVFGFHGIIYCHLFPILFENKHGFIKGKWTVSNFACTIQFYSEFELGFSSGTSEPH